MGSLLDKFIFDPIKAAAARATTSTNPIARAVGAAAQDAVEKIDADISAPANHNSAVGVTNNVVGDLETGLKSSVDAFVTALVMVAGAKGGPIGVAVATNLAPEAVQATNVAIDFAEQHAMTYLSALFAHHRTVIATPATQANAGAEPPQPPPQPQLQPQ